MTSFRAYLLPVVFLFLGLSTNPVQARVRGRAFSRQGGITSRSLAQERTPLAEGEGLVRAVHVRSLEEVKFDPDSDDELFGKPNEVSTDSEPLFEEQRVIGPLPLETTGVGEDEDFDNPEGGATLAHMLDQVLEKEFPDEELHKGTAYGSYEK